MDRIGLPVFVAIRPNAKSKVLAFGKGVSPAAAKASALMEAVELSGAERISSPLQYASYSDLRQRCAVVDVDLLPKLVHNVFDRDRPILWVEGYDLLSDRSIWIPYEVVHLDFSVPLPPGAGSFIPSSNGLASGNTVAEAVSHGICELIERDAAALSAYGQDRRRRVDLASVASQACSLAIERCESAGMGVSLYDITSDVNVPTFLCELAQSAETIPQVRDAIGRGAHLNKSVALLRAITEAAQSRVSVLYGHEGADTRSRDVAQGGCASEESSCNGVTDFAAMPDHSHESVRDDVEALLRLLGDIGITNVIVVVLSQPDDPYAVVRVVVPGLEGIHTVPGYLPGSRISGALTKTA